jgi:hypothetical protein
VPAQQRIWLNDVQRIFPVRCQPSHTDQLDAILVRELRPFLTTLENNQLLAQQRVFNKQIMLATCDIHDQIAGSGSVGWSRHLLDALHDRLCNESKSIGSGLNHSNAPLLGCFQLAEA